MRKFISLKRQQGVGLIELMVSVTIGLLIMAGVVQLYLTSVESQRSQEGLSRIQENIRFASNRLNDEGSSSGFLGCLPRLDDDTRVINLLAEGTGADADGTPEVANFSSSISGKDASGVNSTDEVFFRFALPRSIPLVEDFKPELDDQITLDNSINFQLAYDSIKQWDVAVLTDCNYAVVFIVTNDPGTDGVVALTKGGNGAPSGHPNAGQKNISTNIDLPFIGINNADNEGKIRARLFLAGMGGYSYQVQLSESAKQANTRGGTAQCDSNHPQYCALFRNGQEIMDGVVDFQVEYGWRDGNLVSFGNATAVASAGRWNRVDRVKMDVTLSAIEATGTNDNSSTKRIQREMSQVIMLKNPVVEL
ncbi:PilW family protein [uncultured Pseudoteredinibacter sp.]|uniref:PilW family protein n=1 Tax=uncultured Pseudoteredinibacter sp. TaxID=1641701 RepID=UPI0026335EA7|nr:PilW family protein [uncultured Pseudoteredinibacter sp.]